MKRVRIALIAAGVLATAGAAFATGAAVSDSFHGVRILDGASMEQSNMDGSRASLTRKIGPYPTDAVILFEGAGETRFQPVAGAPAKLAGIRVELREDDFLTEARAESATFAGPGPARMSDGVGQKKLFLKRGEVKTLSIATERTGEFDPAEVSTIARLHLTVIAAPQ